jgi:hypothetical protein
MISAVIHFDTAGNGHCLYTEKIDLAALGALEIARASNIEFNNTLQVWEVTGTDGAVLYTHPSRTNCLAWEMQYLNR